MAIDKIVPETDQAAPPGTTTEPAALGLALSGGGVRAALFSLGVVIGLIETGCNRRLRCVASVSGGSILNAVLAHGDSLSGFSSVKEFEPLASKLAARLAWQGIFAFSWRSIGAALWYLLVVIGRAFVPVVVILVVLADRLRDYWKLDLANLDYSSMPWLLVGLIALGSILLSVLFSRGLLQQFMYASVLEAAGSRPLYVKDWGATSAGNGPGVMHVLVATDLLSGEPMYFSTKFVHCKPYGWSDPQEIRTAEALYSSAAFPAVFPPKKLRTSRLRFQNGDMPGPLPWNLQLADGGIYNNLGYDWFDILREQSQRSPPSLWPFGELSVEPPTIEEENVIIVNAGAPSRRVDWLGPFTLARIMSVLYDNTVEPRVRLIQGAKRPLIDIRITPLKLADSLTKSKGDVGRRAKALMIKLKGRTDEFWSDFSVDTAGTTTKLSRAGHRVAARLMLHGYLSSLVLLHARFDGILPEQIRGEEYFLELVPRPGRQEARPSVHNKPPAETTETGSLPKDNSSSDRRGAAA